MEAALQALSAPQSSARPAAPLATPDVLRAASEERYKAVAAIREALEGGQADLAQLLPVFLPAALPLLAPPQPPAPPSRAGRAAAAEGEAGGEGARLRCSLLEAISRLPLPSEARARGYAAIARARALLPALILRRLPKRLTLPLSSAAAPLRA